MGVEREHPFPVWTEIFKEGDCMMNEAGGPDDGDEEETMMELCMDQGIYADDALHFSFVADMGIDLRNRVISLPDLMEKSPFELFDMAITEMEAADPTQHITLRINSPGGDAFEALAIVGRIQASPCAVVGEVYGMAMSAATVILASCDVRLMSEYATFMWHYGTYELGKIKWASVQDEMSEVERLSKVWSETMAKFSSSKKADAKFWHDAGQKDTYFTAKELLKLGVIDEII